MIIFAVTRQNGIGKYDELHRTRNSALDRFTRLSCSMPPGDRLLLLEIDLGVQKKVRKVREFCK